MNFGTLKVHLSLLILFLFLVPLPSKGFAQEKDIRALSLEEAIKLALKKNEDIGIAKENLAAAKIGVTQSWMNALPQVNGYGQYTRNLDKPTQEVDMFGPMAPLFLANGLPAPGPVEQELVMDNEWAFGLRIDQPLFTSGRILNAVAMSKAYRTVAGKNRSKVMKDTRLGAVEIYFGALLAKENVLIQQQVLKQLSTRAKDIEAKYDRGVASEYDLLFAKTEVAKQEPKVLSAQNDYENALRALATHIGLDQNEPMELTHQLETWPVDFSRETALEKAKGGREELSILRAQSKAQGSQANLNVSNMFPTLSAFGELTYATALNDDFWPQEDEDGFKRYTTVGIAINWPIFDGAQSISKMRRARAEQRATNLSLQKASRGIELEIATLYTQWETKNKEVSANQAAVKMAKRTHELAQLRFDKGLATQLELNDALLNLSATRLELAAAKHDYAVSRARLIRATQD